MWIDNEIYLDDLEMILNEKSIDWKKFSGKSILVSGATGLIGSLIVNALAYVNKKLGLNIEILAMIRNEEKANKMFRKQLDEDLNIKFVINDVCSEIRYSGKVDYIIHAASQTSSRFFVEKPVETVDIIYNGTKNMLEFAKNKKVQDFIFLSTMEVYGRPDTDEKIDEQHSTNLDTMETRNCYPIAKRMAENLCTTYCSEYGVPVKILRLTQTFGPGVDYNDGRVFAEFARCAIENKDIILHTHGETKRNYLYTADAVTAVFITILKGENQQAYNVANEDTYCSIYEMAKLVAEKCADNKISVICDVEEDLTKYGYAPTLKMNLNTNKIRKLGWNPKNNLKNMYRNLIDTF